ncbi:MAG: AsnC family transcriptional regulator [archaeon GW2011_AR21]|nr:MAG: AsnC family transcriptional regulator [archaeon GW2011_AR21]
MSDEKNPKIDDKDRALIQELISDSKQTVGRLARRLGFPPTTIHNRIKKLEKSQVVINYTVNIDYKKLGRPILANVGISINYSVSSRKIRQVDVAKEIKAIPGVKQVSILTGGIDILVEVLAKDIDDLNNIVTEKMRNIDGVDKTQTMIVLKQV